MSHVPRGLDPSNDRVLNVGYRFFGRRAVAHAPGKVRHSGNKAPAILGGQRLDHDRIFELLHEPFLTESTNATSFRIYTGLIGRL